MPFDLTDTQFTGPALPEPFVKFELENELTKLKLLPKTTGSEGKQLKEDWEAYRRHLSQLAVRGGPLRVRNQAIEPLRERLGYTDEIESAPDVETREGREDGGYLLKSLAGAKLRAWTTDLDEDIDAPAKRGQAYRFSHLRIAQRVLLASGERVGILTNGIELRLLISDPARPDSQVIFTLDPDWKRSREVPDSFRLLLALACPAGVEKIPELVDKARLQQARVTKDLRDQARQAVQRFVQEVLDHPENKVTLANWQRANGSPRPSVVLDRMGEGQGVRVAGEASGDPDSPHPNPLPEGEGTGALARALWHEGLIIVYRLLFVLKLESSDDPARSFTFASTSLWRNTFSPSMALARYVQGVLFEGAETGGLLEQGLRGLFRMFHEGVECTELNVKPLGGALFGAEATPVLSKLRWGERAVAHLLDQLLWTTPKKKGGTRERVHYGPLDVEDLGRVYEALLELEPGIATEPMCRLRRQKLEVVVPVAQGEKYRGGEGAGHPRSGSGRGGEEDNGLPSPVLGRGAGGEGDGLPSPTGRGAGGEGNGLPSPSGRGAGGEGGLDADVTEDLHEPEEEEDEDDTPKRGKKTTVQWIEEIQPGNFYLRVGLGRKSTGSYYTPHSFVRFLVQETLGPQVAERSPPDDPQPGEILKLKVVDPACGSGHFLVESCRFLGQHLYEAVRLCDEYATQAETATLPSPVLGRGAGREGCGKSSAASKGPHPNPLPEGEGTYLGHTAAEYRQRVIDLPDPDGELLRYLPSRSVEGEQTGVSQRRAEAICRRMVAVHCLYAVDKNPLAVELAKLALWLESHAEGMPLTFLDHRIVVGDSLTGPFWEQMLSWPSKPKEKLKEGVYHHLETHLRAALFDALRYVRRLEATVGVSVAEVNDKAQAKTELDEALLPFRIAAAAWSGGVMLGPEHCDDAAYVGLLDHIGTTHELPDVIESEGLWGMIGRGLGCPAPMEESRVEGGLRTSDLCTTLTSGRCAPALSFDLTFPEVFYPSGVPYSHLGFDVVLGNPPWKQDDVSEPDFWASADPSLLDAGSSARQLMFEKLRAEHLSMCRTWDDLAQGFEEHARLARALYCCQVSVVEGQQTTGKPDLFRLFAERAPNMLREGGNLGMVYPSSFHNNEGTTGIRGLYLDKLSLVSCYSFINRRKLFEIDIRQKYATVIATKRGATERFRTAYYLEDEDWLFDSVEQAALTYDREFIVATGGPHLIFVECRKQADVDLLNVASRKAMSWSKYISDVKISLSQGYSSTRDAWRRVALADAAAHDCYVFAWKDEVCLPVHEGKTLGDYRDTGETPVFEGVVVSRLGERSHWQSSVPFYRLAQRRIASATNERTSIFCVLPPGCVCLEKVRIETQPSERPTKAALLTLSIGNSFAYDWLSRLRVATTMSQYLVDEIPVCGVTTESQLRLCGHSALRLTCNHSGYAPLWREQVGEAWREEGKPLLTWPVLAGDDERWAVRSAIDAVVADAYGLSRDQYAYVLSTFSHASYRRAPELCLACFDELVSLGLEKFTRKHDPYWDIPLNENLPQPVIDLPIPGEAKEDDSDGQYRLTGATKPAKGARRKK